MFSAFFSQHKHGQIAAQRATSRSLFKYAYHVTCLTRRARQIHISSQITVMAKRGSGGKPCAAGAPGQISCTNNSYSPGISMHTLPKNEKVRAQWVKFVWTHRPDWEPTEYSYVLIALLRELLHPPEVKHPNACRNKRGKQRELRTKQQGVSGKTCVCQRIGADNSPRTKRSQSKEIECGKCPIQLLCFQFSQQACYVCLW